MQPRDGGDQLSQLIGAIHASEAGRPSPHVPPEDVVWLADAFAT
jgi:hypothetical protein